MVNKNINEIVKKLPDVPAPDVTSVFRMFMDYKKEAEITKREIKRLDSAKEILLADIEKDMTYIIRYLQKFFQKEEKQ